MLLSPPTRLHCHAHLLRCPHPSTSSDRFVSTGPPLRGFVSSFVVMSSASCRRGHAVIPAATVLNQDRAMTPLPLSASATVEKSVDQKSCLCRNDLRSSPPPRAPELERSIAFKRWARDRCYRCLARDHQVSSSIDSFLCIRCRHLGHRERHYHLCSTSSTPWVNSSSMHPYHPNR